jgi:8-oxo-dGTP diphosphatase
MIADKPHKTRISGFPLDSISVNIQTGCYYLNESDGERYQQEIIHAKGFRLFFERVMKEL